MDLRVSTVRRRAETMGDFRSLLEQAEHHRPVIECSPDGFWMADTHGRILDSNRAYQRLSGYSRAELLRLTIAELEADGNPTAVVNRIDRVVRLGQERFETSHRTKHGAIWPVEVTASFWPGDGGLLFVFCRDISERLKREQALLELSDSLHTIREQERARIARELHDELGQHLTALKLDLSWLEHRLAGAPAEVSGRIESMKDLIDRTVGAVRRIAHELRPPILDDLGLRAAVDWLADDFVKRTGLTVTRDMEQAVDELPSAHAIAVFRIIQECLTNAARHAQATAVRLTLQTRDDALHLRIADDGRGMFVPRSRQARGLGLAGIGERARMLGGTLAIESAPGKGVSVIVNIPRVAVATPQAPR